MKNKHLDNKVMGTHYILDLFGCDREQINSVPFLKTMMCESIEGTDIVLLDQAFYPFEPQGVTGFFLLSTSHMSVHSWPEHGYISIDIYTCSNDAMTRLVVDKILEKITYQKMVIKTIDRTYDLLSESNNGRLTLTQPIYRDDTEQLIHVSEKVCSIKSGFQSIEIVDTEEYGRSMIIDGIMQTSEKDHHIYDQAILEKLTQNDKEIIILGGGDGYVAETALSMNPNLKITIVDLDVEVVAAAKKYLKQKIFNHPNVTLFIGDALHYLHTRQGEKVDGIISDLTDNPTIKLEENFTEDFKKFFSKVLPLIKKNLKNDGWVTIQCGAAKVTEKYLDTASIIEDVVRMHFSNVSRASVLIPSYGEDNCFISAMHSEHE